MGIQTSFSSSHSYTFNGKTYTSFDEMPPEIRTYFEDKDGSGIPDFVEEKLPKWMIRDKA